MSQPAGGVVESDHPSRWIVTAVGRWLYRAQSPYQAIAIGEVPAWGRCLFLDGWLQLAEADEYLYHEHLVLPALLAHPAPRRVLILGGGDGLAAREALRHRAVEQVTLVDIDGQVVDACRRYLAPLQRGALDDPRVTVHIEDAREFLRRTTERYDVVLMDLVDFTPQTRALYADLLQQAQAALAEGGVLVSHAPDAGPPFYHGLHLVPLARRFFPAVAWYEAFVPSFGTPWTFVLAAAAPLWDQPAARWEERAQALDAPPRAFVPANLPALLTHPPHQRDLVARLESGESIAHTPPAWQSAVLEADTFRRWIRDAGFCFGE